MDTPARTGYRWPAEWEPHAATWLAWPHNPNTWPGTFDRIPPIFARLVRRFAQFEPVRLLAAEGPIAHAARRLVGPISGVEWYDIPTNDAWCRDHGPMFLKGDPGHAVPAALVDWGYNAWGGKYPPFDDDDRVPSRIAERLGTRVFRPEMVLEGGAVDGNGNGTVLTTRSCLLHPGRNPAMTESEIEERLRAFACARHVVWLSGGDFAGDDTDGHVDQLARFVGERTIVVASCGKDDENHATLARLAAELRAARDANGRVFDIVPLPIPQPRFHDGRRLPAGYCNFAIVNGGVLVPEFDDRADARAAGILADLFPDRRVIGFPCLDLVWGLGALHCLSQQQPA
ncbi:MAG: agmatine deiminase family protein [Planctomycetes bacterium]|nr:agmatine deiminase family protein [Planctomycetota bacterium]